MADLSKYISKLIYKHDCVIVEGFGGFVTNPNPAKIDEMKAMIYPPSKQISFNQNLTHNDGLLVNEVALMEGINYTEACHVIKACVQQWHNDLKNGKSIKLSKLGVVSSNIEGKLIFKENHVENYAISSFGLSSIIAQPLPSKAIAAEVKKEVALVKPATEVPAMASVPSERIEERKEKRAYKKWPLAAIGIPLLIGTLFFIGQENNSSNRFQLANMNPFKSSKVVYAPRDTNNSSLGENLETESNSVHEINEVKPDIYHIVGASFKSEANAVELKEQLSAKDYKSSVLKGDNGYFRVAYNSFNNIDLAEIYLAKMKGDVNADAWLLEQE